MFAVHDDIYLEESNHTYTLKNDPDFEFTSCTTFVDLFFAPFDRIGIANRLTTSHPDYIGTSPQELVAVWDKSAQEGTEVHLQIDNFIKNKTIPTSSKALLAVQWLRDKALVNNPLFSETIIYSKEIKIAGTVDLLVYNQFNNTYDIYDWKTSKKIDQRAYNYKCGIYNATKNIADCNYFHYVLQLSLYRYILEKYYNISVNKLTILHINDFGITPYECDYFKSTIELMFVENLNCLRENFENGLTKDYLNNF